MPKVVCWKGLCFQAPSMESVHEGWDARANEVLVTSWL